MGALQSPLQNSLSFSYPPLFAHVDQLLLVGSNTCLPCPDFSPNFQTPITFDLRVQKLWNLYFHKAYSKAHVHIKSSKNKMRSSDATQSRFVCHTHISLYGSFLRSKIILHLMSIYKSCKSRILYYIKRLLNLSFISKDYWIYHLYQKTIEFIINITNIFLWNLEFNSQIIYFKYNYKLYIDKIWRQTKHTTPIFHP
jgi:hypothetical protein